MANGTASLPTPYPSKNNCVHRWPLSQEDRRVLYKQELIKSHNSLVRQLISTKEGEVRQRVSMTCERFGVEVGHRITGSQLLRPASPS